MTESPQAMHERLLRATAASRFTVLPDDYGWLPMAGGAAPTAQAIACVRDGDVWHQLLPVPQSHPGARMCVVSFHFPEDISTAGFIAWLSAWVKREAQTGVVVIGGKDKNASPALERSSFGVFDFWCCGADRRMPFIDAIERLITEGTQLPA